MQRALLVGVMDGGGDLADVSRRLLGGQRTLANQRRQRLALDIGHGEVVLSFMHADLIDRHDARMLQVGGRLGFHLETADVGLRNQAAVADQLDGDRAVQAELPGLVDHAHAAASQLLQQFVVADVADSRSGRASLRAERGELVLGGEQVPQLFGELGMPRQPGFPIGVLARVRRFQVGGDDLVEAVLPSRRVMGIGVAHFILAQVPKKPCEARSGRDRAVRRRRPCSCPTFRRSRPGTAPASGGIPRPPAALPAGP